MPPSVIFLNNNDFPVTVEFLHPAEGSFVVPANDQRTVLITPGFNDLQFIGNGRGVSYV